MIVLGGGLLARLAVTIFLADNRTLYFEHMLIARNLLGGNGYSWDEWGRALLQPTSLVPPLHVYWCAFFQWLSPHNFLPMYAAQAVVSVSGCIPAYLIGRRLISARAGVIFAALYAVYPEFVFIHSKAVAESIYVVLVLWMLERYFALCDTPPASRSALRVALTAGLVAGMAMLFKEAAVVVALAITLAMMIRYGLKWNALRSSLIPFAATTILVLSPWIIRNAIVQGEFIPLRTAFGINWWVANQPGSAGNDRTLSGGYVLSDISPEYKDYMNRILPVDEQDRDREYKAEVWRFIRAHPMEYVKLCGRRLLYWVWFVPGHQLASNWFYRASWITLLLFAIPGFVLLARQRRINIVWPLILVGYVLYYVPTIVLPRYRVVTAVVLLFFAAASVNHLVTRWLETRPTRLPSSSTARRPSAAS